MKHLLRGETLRAAGGRLLGLYLRIAIATARWRVLGEENLAPFLPAGGVIIAFWHERLALMPKVCLHSRRTGPRQRLRVVAMVSRHRDGQLIGTVLEAFGIERISASTNHGGVAGMKSALDRLADGQFVAIVPDGPRGPARLPAPGVAAIAALSGQAILPCAAMVTPFRRFGGWDRMIFPLPFGRGTLLFGPPIRVPRRGAAEALPAIAAALDAVTAAADAAHAGRAA